MKRVGNSTVGHCRTGRRELGIRAGRGVQGGHGRRDDDPWRRHVFFFTEGKGHERSELRQTPSRRRVRGQFRAATSASRASVGAASSASRRVRAAWRSTHARRGICSRSNGNVVVSAPVRARWCRTSRRRRRLTSSKLISHRRDRDISHGNVGGGIKWGFRPGAFVATDTVSSWWSSKDDAPEVLWARDPIRASRLYGAVLG